MGFSDLVLVHNGGFLLRNHLAFAMKENDGADRLAVGQNLLRRIHTVAGGHLNDYHRSRALLDQACKRSDTQNGTENDHEVVFNF